MMDGKMVMLSRFVAVCLANPTSITIAGSTSICPLTLYGSAEPRVASRSARTASSRSVPLSCTTARASPYRASGPPATAAAKAWTTDPRRRILAAPRLTASSPSSGRCAHHLRIPFQPVLRIPWPFDHQDLDASAGVLEQEEGVYYAVIPTTNEDFASWNKLVVTWSIRVFSSNTPVNFQSILFGDGTVLL